MGLDPADRPADGRAQSCRVRRYQARRRHDGVLRRSVVVEQPERQPVGRRLRQRVAAGEQYAQRGVGRPRLGQYGGGDRGRQECRGDPLFAEPAHQFGRRGPQVRRDDGQGGARREGGPDLPGRRVEPGAREQRGAVRRIERVLGQVPGDQVGEPPVCQCDALGPAGRSRGVDEVRQPLRGDLVRVDRFVRGRGVQVEHLEAAGGCRQLQPCPGGDENLPYVGVLQDEGDALGRVARVHGQVAPTGHEHREFAGHQLGGTIGVHRHRFLGGDTGLTEPVGQCAGALPQVRVAELPVRPTHRDGVRSGPHLARDLLGHRLGTGRGGPVGPAVELVRLRLREQAQCPHRRLRPVHRVGEQGQVVRDHPLHGGFVEQVGRMLPDHGEVVVLGPGGPAEALLGPRDHDHVEVRLGRGVRAFGDPAGEPTEVDVGYSGVVEAEHDLEERGARRVTGRVDRVDHRVHRGVRPGQGLGDAQPYLCQQFTERLVGRHLGAHDQGVDEHAEQRLQLGDVAVRRAGPDEHVLLPGVAVEQRREAGVHGGEQRHPVLAAEGSQLAGQLGGDEDARCPATEGHHRRSRPVGGQFQGVRGAGQTGGPVVDVGLQYLAAQPVPLPDRVVGVLDGQFGQR